MQSPWLQNALEVKMDSFYHRGLYAGFPTNSGLEAVFSNMGKILKSPKNMGIRQTIGNRRVSG